MKNLTRRRSSVAALVVVLVALAVPGAAMGQELPPAIQVDRHILQADAFTRDGDAAAALAALERILELQAEHGVEIPEAFWFRHAQAALAAGNAEMAVTSAVRYLQLTVQDGEHYIEALEVLNEAEALQSRFPPGARFSDCDVCPEMVVVPAGTFTMGSPEPPDSDSLNATEARQLRTERPQHSVTIPAPFAVGVYEVTFAEWEACVRAGGCDALDDEEGWGRGRRPVIGVNWNRAQAYVSWLSEQTGARYRLLSEAEWEYAARAGSRTARYWGASESDQCRYENGADLTLHEEYGFFDPVQCSDGYVYTAPVGSFAPNEFGLYDMLGNAQEWTQDCWHGSYAGAPTDGNAWQSGDCGARVLRGGTWSGDPRDLRSTRRDALPPNYAMASGGFRVARTLN